MKLTIFILVCVVSLGSACRTAADCSGNGVCVNETCVCNRCHAGSSCDYDQKYGFTAFILNLIAGSGAMYFYLGKNLLGVINLLTGWATMAMLPNLVKLLTTCLLCRKGRKRRRTRPSADPEAAQPMLDEDLEDPEYMCCCCCSVDGDHYRQQVNLFNEWLMQVLNAEIWIWAFANMCIILNGTLTDSEGYDLC